MGALLGCGQTAGRDGQFAPLFVSDCEAGVIEREAVRDVVLLDWSGGVSRIFPDWELPGLDFSAFATAEGGTLADDEDVFKESVRRHVARLLCDFPVAVSVRTGEGPSDAPFNVVYVAHAASPRSAKQIGEGEYDICNVDHDNDAVIFGEEIQRLGAFTFDEWVMAFGNVVAHEIGHTLGFGHVSRDDAGAEHPLYVELMLSPHTLDELLSDQRFLSDLTNCPADAAQSRRIIPSPTLTCGEPGD